MWIQEMMPCKWWLFSCACYDYDGLPTTEPWSEASFDGLLTDDPGAAKLGQFLETHYSSFGLTGDDRIKKYKSEYLDDSSDCAGWTAAEVELNDAWELEGQDAVGHFTSLSQALPMQ